MMKRLAPISHRYLAHLLAALVVATPALLVGPAGPGTRAFAQSDDAIEQAKEQFFLGQQAYEEERFEEAAEAFLSAYRLSERAELLYNVGKSYWNAKDLKNAERYFQEYINAMPEAANVNEVVESIITIQQEMAAQMAEVKVDASRPGIEVYVAQEADPRCKTPCAVLLMPGEHTLSVRPAGDEPISKTITVQAEQNATLRFELPGKLQVRTDQRGGSLSIDGEGTHPLPMRAPVSLSPGDYALRITGADGESWTGSVEVTSGELAQILIPIAHLDAGASGGGMSTLRTVSLALAGLSVGLATGGVLMGMQAGDTHAALEKRQNALGGVDPAMVEQGRAEQTAANMLYIASAVSLATGAGLFTWDLLSQDSDAADIPPSEPAPPAQPAPAEQPAEEDDLLLELGAR